MNYYTITYEEYYYHQPYMYVYIYLSIYLSLYIYTHLYIIISLSLSLSLYVIHYGARLQVRGLRLRSRLEAEVPVISYMIL